MVAIAREIRTGAAPMTDIRDQLAQIRSILDDIDRDLSPRALKGQEDYDAILAIIDHRARLNTPVKSARSAIRRG